MASVRANCLPNVTMIAIIIMSVLLRQVVSEKIEAQTPSAHTTGSTYRIGAGQQPKPESLSVITGGNMKPDTDFIYCPKPPAILYAYASVQFEFRCMNVDKLAGMEIQLTTPYQTDIVVFRQTWKCASGGMHQERIIVKLPDPVGYKPGYTNPNSMTVDSVLIRAWLIDKRKEMKRSDMYQEAAVKVSYNTRILDPWERRERPSYSCFSWWQSLQMSQPYSAVCPQDQVVVEILLPQGTWSTHKKSRIRRRPAGMPKSVEYNMTREKTPPKPRLKWCYDWWGKLLKDRQPKMRCSNQYEVYRAVSFPVALSGTMHGVHRALPPYKHKVLQLQHNNQRSAPEFTISVWLYIMEYCPSVHHLCSIVQRLTWDDLYMTPLIFINKLGQLHLQVVTAQGRPLAFLTRFVMPKDRWCHLVASYSNQNKQFTVTVKFGEDWSESFTDSIKFAARDWIYHDDQVALYIFGGTEITPAFKGFIGQATVYRMKSFTPEELPVPSPYHPMFELELDQRDERCRDLLGWVEQWLYRSYKMLQFFIQKRSCPATFEDTFLKPELWTYTPPDRKKYCSLFGGPRPVEYRAVGQWVKKKVFEGRFSLGDLADHLYQNVTEAIDAGGLGIIRFQLLQLKQASCYGNLDAMFLLSVVLNHGIGVKSHQILAHSYLMTAALENHRLALLAMATKHVQGLDGIPTDNEQAYVYMKNAADITHGDREAHKEGDIFTEKIRLTDETAMQEQTDEDGDLFLWMRHQAQQGVYHSQRNMARMLFWGSQGVQRNLEAAVEYYRQGAEAAEDANALYDYGIVLLRGQGIEKNTTAAIEYLEKAAAMGHMGALNAIGWYMMEVEHNLQEAADRFQQAHKAGNPDAAHNLGHMFLSGKYPNHPQDRVEAMKYFSDGAVRGQLDSSLMVALYNMRGHPILTPFRDPFRAVDWARWVAEHNPKLGLALAKGLKHYRHQNWPAALLYYMLVAETGIEVGTFNLAFLSDDNKEYMTSFVEKECVWRNFNLSTQRAPHLVDPYSWIKMGDMYWYGCQGYRNARKAALMYANGAQRGDPHSLFNLGFMVEDGVHVPNKVWRALEFSKRSLENNVTLLTEVYTRCKESYNTEAYLPCSLALWRIQFLDLWTRYHVVFKFSSMVGTVALTAFTASSIYAYFHTRQLTINNV